MSELKDKNTIEQDTNVDTTHISEKDELKVLRERATMLGITYSGSTGIKTLREKINAKLNEDPTDVNSDADTDDTENIEDIQIG